MDYADPKESIARTRHLCSLQKEGRHIAFFLTELEGGGFELKLTRSDAPTRSVQLFRAREDAIVEAERQLRNYMAHGWAFDYERR